jgi:hypothetical protein
VVAYAQPAQLATTSIQRTRRGSDWEGKNTGMDLLGGALSPGQRGCRSGFFFMIIKAKKIILETK